MYPNTADIKFDIDYYKAHLPMITAALGDALKEWILVNRRSQFQANLLFCFIVDLKFESVATFKPRLDRMLPLSLPMYGTTPTR
jgi:hypothetical protein